MKLAAWEPAPLRAMIPGPRRENGMLHSSGAPNILWCTKLLVARIFWGEASSFLLSTWLTTKTTLLVPPSVCSSSTIICFGGIALQGLCKTGEKLCPWVGSEIDDIAAAGKEQRICDALFLPNPEICVWV